MTDSDYIKRCFDLAKLGKQYAAPNPYVGAVILHEGKIIGEGYHKQYGKDHAEVNAFNSVKLSDKSALPKSSMYVSLEPCNIHGKTPPCAKRIVDEEIAHVFVSEIDQTQGVNKEGVERIAKAGIGVKTGILQKQGESLAKIRNVYVSQRRPYIILKWAESLDGYLGSKGKQVWLSNKFSRRLVHKWRSETSAILVGTNTALIDNPALNNRYYSGPQPLRIYIDRFDKIPQSHQLKDKSIETWALADEPKLLIKNLLNRLHKNQKTSLLVEGGATLLNSFIERDLWDEIRVIKTNTLLRTGIKSPELTISPIKEYKLLEDTILQFKKEAD